MSALMAYPDPYVTVGRASHTVIRHDGRIREDMDRSQVLARPTLYARYLNNAHILGPR